MSKEYIVSPETAHQQIIYAAESRGQRQATEFVAGRFGGHFQQALSWIALNDYPQDLRHVFASMRRMYPKSYHQQATPHTSYLHGLDDFDYAFKHAIKLVENNEAPTILEGLDNTFAQKWDDGARPQTVYTINTDSVCERIKVVYGMHNWCEPNAGYTLVEIQNAIDIVF